ncbi:hypothetical protein ACFSQP_02030 [Bizionia sediminis]|uniref:GLPGLI family protein n=1 Tax=Bizionia sediminis TaxID=1737064 RepID=A0ABW5KS59_9FLAO
MMPVFRILIVLLVPIWGFSQKSFQFDYMLTYENVYVQKDSLKDTTVYLTNAADNSYFISLKDISHTEYELTFTQHDMIRAQVKINKTAFLANKYLNVVCSHVSNHKNTVKKVANNYQFTAVMDTIINNNTYASYSLKPTYSTKKRLKHKAGTNLYIINTQIPHLPMFTHPTAYEKWLSEKRLPHGIPVKKCFKDEKNELYNCETLIRFSSVNKQLVLTGNCAHLE